MIFFSYIYVSHFSLNPDDVLYTLVEKEALVPVPEGLLYRKSNRYKRFGTKAPPLFGTGSLQTGIKGASTWAPRGVQARDL
jgi:hypothetical protein